MVARSAIRSASSRVVLHLQQRDVRVVFVVIERGVRDRVVGGLGEVAGAAVQRDLADAVLDDDEGVRPQARAAVPAQDRLRAPQRDAGQVAAADEPDQRGLSPPSSSIASIEEREVVLNSVVTTLTSGFWSSLWECRSTRPP